MPVVESKRLTSLSLTLLFAAAIYLSQAFTGLPLSGCELFIRNHFSKFCVQYVANSAGWDRLSPLTKVAVLKSADLGPKPMQKTWLDFSRSKSCCVNWCIGAISCDSSRNGASKNRGHSFFAHSNIHSRCLKTSERHGCEMIG